MKCFGKETTNSISDKLDKTIKTTKYFCFIPISYKSITNNSKGKIIGKETFSIFALYNVTEFEINI